MYPECTAPKARMYARFYFSMFFYFFLFNFTCSKPKVPLADWFSTSMVFTILENVLIPFSF